MAEFWIADAAGRVLGPVGLTVLEDLTTTGRLKDLVRASRDGKNWKPLSEIPELARLGVAPAPADRRSQESETARHHRALLEQMQGRPAHELFKVARGAALQEYRSAFFSMVKRYYPDRLPADVDPALHKACEDVFLFLAGAMAQFEKGRLAEGSLTVRAPATATVSAASRPKPAPPAPRYLPGEFVGFERRGEERMFCEVQVSPKNAAMFTGHKLMNLANGSVFLASSERLPLGTLLEMVFDFDRGRRLVKAAGKVAWENQADPKNLRGYGVRLLRIAPEDVAFVKEYVAVATQKG